MKREIEQVLAPLIGQPLTDMWRYAGCQKFEFGDQLPHVNRKGEDITRADLGLVVACHWRLEAPDGGYISSDDYGLNGARYRDDQNGPVIRRALEVCPTVQTISAGGDGALLVTMSDGYKLRTWPDETDDRSTEQFRFMPKDQGESHFVVLIGGIER